jgi:hypothetical protein
MSPQAEEIEYEGLPDSADHGVHMFAGALVSSTASRTAQTCAAKGGMLTE